MYYVAKIKVLIRCAVTTQLICTFVLAYAKSRFSRDAAQIITKIYIYIVIDVIFKIGLCKMLRKDIQ